jgi:uncharacterized protein YycO
MSDIPQNPTLPSLFRAVRLVTEDSFASWFIRRATNSRWSHIDIVTEGGFLSARIDGGVKVRPWDYLAPTRTAYGIFVPKSADAGREGDAWLFSVIGEKYDWTAILAMPFGADWAFKDHYFCSELVADYAEKCGTPLQRRTTYRVSPQDVYESLEIRILAGRELAALKLRFGIPAEF